MISTEKNNLLSSRQLKLKKDKSLNLNPIFNDLSLILLIITLVYIFFIISLTNATLKSEDKYTQHYNMLLNDVKKSYFPHTLETNKKQNLNLVNFESAKYSDYDLFLIELGKAGFSFFQNFGIELTTIKKLLDEKTDHLEKKGSYLLYYKNSDLFNFLNPRPTIYLSNNIGNNIAFKNKQLDIHANNYLNEFIFYHELGHYINNITDNNQYNFLRKESVEKILDNINNKSLLILTQNEAQDFNKYAPNTSEVFEHSKKSYSGNLVDVYTDIFSEGVSDLFGVMVMKNKYQDIDVKRTLNLMAQMRKRNMNNGDFTHFSYTTLRTSSVLLDKIENTPNLKNDPLFDFSKWENLYPFIIYMNRQALQISKMVMSDNKNYADIYKGMKILTPEEMKYVLNNESNFIDNYLSNTNYADNILQSYKTYYNNNKVKFINLEKHKEINF